jgi:hypothetical protein
MTGINPFTPSFGSTRTTLRSLPRTRELESNMRVMRWNR